MLSKAKAKDLEERKKEGENVQAEMTDLRQIEQKYTPSPFISLSALRCELGCTILQWLHPSCLLEAGTVCITHSYIAKISYTSTVSFPALLNPTYSFCLSSSIVVPASMFSSYSRFLLINICSLSPICGQIWIECDD